MIVQRENAGRQIAAISRHFSATPSFVRTRPRAICRWRRWLWENECMGSIVRYGASHGGLRPPELHYQNGGVLKKIMQLALSFFQLGKWLEASFSNKLRLDPVLLLFVLFQWNIDCKEHPTKGTSPAPSGREGKTNLWNCRLQNLRTSKTCGTCQTCWKWLI